MMCLPDIRLYVRKDLVSNMAYTTINKHDTYFNNTLITGMVHHQTH